MRSLVWFMTVRRRPHAGPGVPGGTLGRGRGAGRRRHGGVLGRAPSHAPTLTLTLTSILILILILTLTLILNPNANPNPNPDHNLTLS